jgi:protocatechuate 3,4-dioxygenase beta subunit
MHHHDDGSRGFDSDLSLLLRKRLDRRSAMRTIASASAIPLVGCVTASTGLVTGSDAGTGGDGASATCTTVPEETAGPYPGDGTNGPNALALSGIVRSDIRPSLTGASAVAGGVPLTVTLQLVQSTAGCVPLSGYAVYLWHCDRGGNYSMYSSAVSEESYLRGVQETDADGRVTFTTIFPACYAGRWPHMHFEIYAGLSSATGGSNAIATSQLALPEASCNEVFATAGYESSVRNLAAVTLSSDNVFRDGTSSQLPTILGDVTSGYAASLVVGVSG